MKLINHGPDLLHIPDPIHYGLMSAYCFMGGSRLQALGDDAAGSSLTADVYSELNNESAPHLQKLSDKSFDFLVDFLSPVSNGQPLTVKELEEQAIGALKDKSLIGITTDFVKHAVSEYLLHKCSHNMMPDWASLAVHYNQCGKDDKWALYNYYKQAFGVQLDLLMTLGKYEIELPPEFQHQTVSKHLDNGMVMCQVKDKDTWVPLAEFYQRYSVWVGIKKDDRICLRVLDFSSTIEVITAKATLVCNDINKYLHDNEDVTSVAIMQGLRLVAEAKFTKKFGTAVSKYHAPAPFITYDYRWIRAVEKSSEYKSKAKNYLNSIALNYSSRKPLISKEHLIPGWAGAFINADAGRLPCPTEKFVKALYESEMKTGKPRRSIKQHLEEDLGI